MDDKQFIEAIRAVVRDEVREQLEPIREQQEVHTRSIVKLENSVMHELKLLNENLPDAIARHGDLRRLEDTVETHDARIYALEQQAANS